MASGNTHKPTLGTRIRAARDAKSWKQKQLAAALGVEPVTVSRWERNENTPDLNTLARIASVLERPLSYFTEAVEPTRQPLPEVQVLEREVRALRNLMEEMLQEQRRLRRALPPSPEE